MKKFPLLLLILVFVVTAGCHSKPDSNNQKKQAEKPIPVRLATIEFRDLWRTVSAVGTAKPLQLVRIKSKIPGKITRIRVNEGSKVKKGAILAELDPTDYNLAVKNARAGLKSASLALKEVEVTLKNTRQDWKRYQRLYEKKVISRQKWNHIDTGYRKTRIMRDIASSRVSRAEIALEVALTNLKDTQLRAPFEGIITRRFVDPGNRVYTMPPTVLMTLMDISHVKIVSDVPEKEMPRLHVAAPVLLKFDAFPGKIFQEKITRIYPGVDPVTRNFTIEINLDNPGGKIKAGMFAHVKIKVRKIRALVIPRSALLKIPGTGIYYTFRVTGDTVEKVNLETGVFQDNLVQVLKGLKQGDRVVAVGNTRLKTGRKITIIKAETQS